MIKATKEQLDIINAVQAGKSIKVSALAGAAKTTTLVMAAEASVKPILYLTFNKAMAEEAKQKFPSWVEVRTTHSMAFAAIGFNYQSKLKRPRGKYINVAGTASEVARFFKVSPLKYAKDKWIGTSAIGHAVLSTVRAFEHSAENELDLSHVSFFALRAKRIDLKSPNSVSLIKEYQQIVLKHAQALWSLRCNLKSQVLAEHDTYLKLYQLSNPNLSQYEIVMLDEAQDTNACVVDIIKNQKDSQIVVVGDPNQAIYQFRGALNALDKFDFESYSLSKSFRYSQEVADIGMAITGRSGMLGFEEITTTVSEIHDFLEIPEKHTAIYRTNAGMIADAVKAISDGYVINIIADMWDFTNLIDSALALKSGDIKKVKHQSLLVYENWKELEEDLEWCSGEIQRVVQMIRDNTVLEVLGLLKVHRNVDNPDIVFLTAHKCKGLEYKNVILGGDFPSIFDKNGVRKELPQSETNLLYVASTRASKSLVINSQVKEYLETSRYSQKRGPEINIKNIKSYDRSMVPEIDSFTKDLDQHIAQMYTSIGLGGVEKLMSTGYDDCDLDGNEFVFIKNVT